MYVFLEKQSQLCELFCLILSQRSSMVCAFQEHSYPTHHELMRQFHPITHVYILLEGSVELTALTMAPARVPCDPDTLTPAAVLRQMRGLSLGWSTFAGMASGFGSRANGPGTQPGEPENGGLQARRSSVWDTAGLPVSSVRVLFLVTLPLCDVATQLYSLVVVSDPAIMHVHFEPWNLYRLVTSAVQSNEAYGSNAGETKAGAAPWDVCSG